MLNDFEISAILDSRESNAIGFLGDGSDTQKNRKAMYDYYNQKHYGDEVEGQSQVVTSDVADVVESLVPQLLRIFAQNRIIGRFVGSRPEFDKEAQQKTEYASWVFNRKHNGAQLLHEAIKESLLQYCGVPKVYWEESEERTESVYNGIGELDLMQLEQNENVEIKEVELLEGEEGQEKTFSVVVDNVNKRGYEAIENVPADEFLIGETDRDFIKPSFIGQRTPKTRSQLIEMGFDPEIVKQLGQDTHYTTVKEARNNNTGQNEENDTGDTSQDIIYLGEYYTYIDVDDDGISEYWQFFYSNNKVLSKQRVDTHPYCPLIPVPIPHRAIGTCPAEQVMDLQYLKSTLVRQMLNNVYNVNYSRTLYNERVNDDDLLNPVPGGGIRVEGQGPIGDSATPFVVQSQVVEILQSIEYVDTMREIRTGVTRYNQGVDTESLNKTATGFIGIRDMSQMRIETIARSLAVGVQRIFERIIELASKYQRTPVQIRVLGEPMEINPADWKDKIDCYVDVGIGAGDRREKIANLSQTYAIQSELKMQGSPLSDDVKRYNTLSKLVQEIGLQDETEYYNNPAKPIELLMAENEQMQAIIQQMQAQLQNPLAEAEAVKGQTQVQLKQVDANLKVAQEQIKSAEKEADRLQKDRHHQTDTAVKLTEIEAREKVNVPGAVI
jgi:hypothetical protein